MARIKFESVGVPVSRMEGNTRFYYWGRGPIVAALEKFLLEMVDLLPEATYARRYVTRRRPRRQGKALRHARGALRHVADRVCGARACGTR